MSTHTVRRSGDDGARHAVVELNGVSHVLAAALPRGGATLPEQATDALEGVATVMAAEGAAAAAGSRTAWVSRTTVPAAVVSIRQMGRGDMRSLAIAGAAARRKEESSRGARRHITVLAT
jgi:hypothetical protein